MQPPRMQNFTKSSWLNSQREKISFRKSLLAWFDQNQRSLPWRKNPSLYKTVVSEMMLQQTRVSTVLPYFENWMRSFPDFHALASASEESVLKAWEGLGYYSRARNLHKLSKIATNWKVFPQNIEDWKSYLESAPILLLRLPAFHLGRQMQCVTGMWCGLSLDCLLSLIFLKMGQQLKKTSASCPAISLLNQTRRLQPSTDGAWCDYLPSVLTLVYSLPSFILVSVRPKRKL